MDDPTDLRSFIILVIWLLGILRDYQSCLYCETRQQQSLPTDSVGQSGMGLLTIIRKVKRNEREIRILLVCVVCVPVVVLRMAPGLFLSKPVGWLL